MYMNRSNQMLYVCLFHLKQCDYLMDPMIGIIGLNGKGEVGKTTIIKNTYNLIMDTKIFDKII